MSAVASQYSDLDQKSMTTALSVWAQQLPQLTQDAANQIGAR